MRRIEVIRTVNRCLFRLLLVTAGLVTLAALIVAYARFVEPTWLCVREVKLASSPTVRVIHVTDLHFKGNTQYLERVVARINNLNADVVCFTGDLVEEASALDGALPILARINKPLYGIPGNHDVWAIRSFDGVRATFSGTGGAWLTRDVVLALSNRVAMLTLPCAYAQTFPGAKRILLTHHPESAARLRDARFDLILAGHTHGGQSGIPIVRQLAGTSSTDLDGMVRGLFQTPCGPLYVNPGIGTFYLNLRFLCRPEITLIEL